MKDEEEKQFRSGYVSIVGRPNVGKSTLLNSILGEKIAIVTSKPQTTRNKIIGIKTFSRAQIIFMDTPGIHRPKHKLGETMVKTAIEALKDIDIVLFMVEPKEPGKEEREIIKIINKLQMPVFLIINKIDLVRKTELLPLIDKYMGLFNFNEIIPVSALKQDGISTLLNSIYAHLPQGPKYYPDDLVTDQIERFMVSEIIREKIIEALKEELPYSVAVQIIEWKERKDGLISIRCNIYVEREGQKAIIIGKEGTMLKSIGTAARVEIEGLLNAKVFLELWVKVRKNWRNNNRILRELGYL